MTDEEKIEFEKEKSEFEIAKNKFNEEKTEFEKAALNSSSITEDINKFEAEKLEFEKEKQALNIEKDRIEKIKTSMANFMQVAINTYSEFGPDGNKMKLYPRKTSPQGISYIPLYTLPFERVKQLYNLNRLTKKYMILVKSILEGKSEIPLIDAKTIGTAIVASTGEIVTGKAGDNQLLSKFDAAGTEMAKMATLPATNQGDEDGSHESGQE